jgi:hypothetical protein
MLLAEHQGDNVDDEIGIGITPGIALVAANCIAEEKPTELREMVKYVKSGEVLGSVVQTALSVIDWYAVSSIGDEIAVAYENDDQDTLDALAERGFTFYPAEDGTLELIATAESATNTPFPDEMWGGFEERLAIFSPITAEVFGVHDRTLLVIAHAVVYEGIIPMRNKVAQVDIAYYESRESVSDEELAYITAVAAGLITHALISTVVEYRNKSVSQIGLEKVTYDDVVDAVREALTAMLLEDAS